MRIPAAFNFPIIFLTLVYTTFAQPALPPPVLSIQGKPITTSQCLYIKPAHFPELNYTYGGGLGLRSSSMFANATDSYCPLGVVREILPLKDGLCVFFHPVLKPDDGIIRVSTDLNLEFGFPDTCNQAVVWKLEKVWGTKYVNLGGEIGNPGPKTVDSWFKVESIVGDELRYKIVHCPGTTVCPSPCKIKCKDVGIVSQNGRPRLALAKKPYHILFDLN